MNQKLKPKDVSDAYALYAFLADKDACKERLDQLTIAEDAATAAQTQAARDVRTATDALARMNVESVQLKKREDELFADKELYEINMDDLNNRIKTHQNDVANMDADYRKKNLELTSREKNASIMEQDAKELKDAANILMDQAKAMKAQYEGKLKALKELV